MHSSRRLVPHAMRMLYNVGVLKYLVVGRWLPGAVSTRLVPSARRETAESHAAIESAWSRLGRDPMLHLFDGPMCRLENFQATPVALRLNLSLTSYKIFLGTNLHGPRELPKETLANPVGVSPALETADGFLLFGRRNASVAYYPNRLHPFSGALEPPGTGETLDIFGECRRELAEELNLTANEVPEITLLGIVEDQEIRHPELVLHAWTTLSRSAVEARLDLTEHAGLHAVAATRASVEEALSDPAFTPVGHAALRLWAWARFGVGLIDSEMRFEG